MNSGAQPQQCQSCGTPLRDATPEGLCPGCVLGMALQALTSEATPEPSAGLDSPETLLERGTLAGYELLEQVGRGGMGVVFKARQQHPSRLVALKVIAAGELASPKMVARFHLEAKAAANLQHPNIVPVYEVGAQGGWHYFSMQLVAGATLAEVIQALHRRPKPPSSAPGNPDPPSGTSSPSPAPAEATAQRLRDPRQLALLLRQLTQAVHHAHQQGVLHRDLKPTNILLDGEGKPYLTDFGLAKILDEDDALTLTASVLGTPAYMSPEQASGRMKDLSVASDVYSLGAVMYELLTGRPPFVAPTTHSLLRMIVENDPMPPQAVRVRDGAGCAPGRTSLSAALSLRDLDVICLKCLEKDPARRYDSAARLAEDLDHWLAGEPILARPATSRERVWKWTRRHPALAALLLTILSAATVISAGSVAFNFRLNQARLAAEKSARENLRTVVRQLGTAASTSAQQADGLSGLHALARALELAAPFPDLQNSLRWRQGLTKAWTPRPVRVWDAQGLPEELCFTRDGSRLVLSRKDAPPCVWQLSDGQRVDPYAAVPSSASVPQFAISPGGNLAAEFTSLPPFATLVDLRNGQRSLLPIDEPVGTAAVFSDDERQLVTGGSRLRLWDLARMEEVPLARRVEGPFDRLFLGRQGTKLVAVRPGEQAILVDLPSGQQSGTQVPCNITSDLGTPHFSRDGGFCVIGHQLHAQLFSTDDWRLLGELPQSGALFGGAFSGDGEVVATASFRGNVRLWDTRTRLTIPPQLNHENGARTVAFSPNGQVLATGGFDHQVRLWRRGDWRRVAPALPHEALVRQVLFSPDGRYLATTSSSGLVRLWDARPGLEWLGQASLSNWTWVASLDDRRFLVTENEHQRRLYRWDGSHWTQGHPFPIASPGLACLDGAGRRLAVTRASESVSVLETETGRTLHSFPIAGKVTALALSPDGEKLAVATDPPALRIITVANGRTTVFHVPDLSRVQQLVWSPDGTKVFTGEASGARLWHADSGEPQGEWIQAAWGVNSIRFSPDGRLAVIALADRNSEPSCAVLVDVRSGRTLPRTLGHSDGVQMAVFSPDGTLVATAGEDNAVRLWQARTGLPAGPSMHHEGMVRCLAFSPDGRWLASGGIDSTLRMWEVSSGELMAAPLPMPRPVFSMSFAPDGRQLVALTVEGSLWRVPLCQDEGSAADWELYATLATGHHRDAEGALVRLAPAELAVLSSTARWNSGPLEGPEAAERWHEQQAGWYEQAGRWFAAAFHWNKLMALRPHDPAVAARAVEAWKKWEASTPPPVSR